ncbi:tyrosine-type recombinase/integrase [Niallia nealsonii]|uniref:tyrosine-type recombinase/integrase n=1 Tax=Niallia nealsonii TaxID=115979 RepID=UPI0012FEA26B|nr:site-specific integrase [Niallia nealsonii]
MNLLFPEYVQSYIENLIDSGKSKLTLKQYESDIKKFINWLEKEKKSTDFETFAALQTEDIRAYFLYLREQDLSQATIRRLASVLSRLMKFHQVIAAEEIHKLSEALPMRSLTENDFIKKEEYNRLLESLQTKEIEQTKKSARNYLLDRNIAIVQLIRTYGLTPQEIHNLTMKNINFAQKELILEGNEASRKFTLEEDIIKNIRAYFFSIPSLFRPKYHTLDPLFVAFNNISYSFQYDYDVQRPKVLSVRAIQEMIKDEVRKIPLRKISAVTLRNTAILDYIKEEHRDEQIMKRFALTSEAALRRYKQFIEAAFSTKETNKGK